METVANVDKPRAVADGVASINVKPVVKKMCSVWDRWLQFGMRLVAMRRVRCGRGA